MYMRKVNTDKRVWLRCKRAHHDSMIEYARCGALYHCNTLYRPTWREFNDDGTQVSAEVEHTIEGLMATFTGAEVLGPNSAIAPSAAMRMALAVLNHWNVEKNESSFLSGRSSSE